MLDFVSDFATEAEEVVPPAAPADSDAALLDAYSSAAPRRHARVAGIGNASGAVLTALDPEGPAAKAGLMSLDLVVRADGQAVTGVDDLIRLLNHERIGRAVTIEALRRGQLRRFAVTPLERRAKSR
ncbi:MAG: PDZ domain-containing protein [Pseudorhodoplanes sp.]